MDIKKSDAELFLENPAHLEFEKVPCYSCGAEVCEEFLYGEDDLTAKDGLFRYVKCGKCDLVYQNPRLTIESVKEFYDSEYIAHRKKKDFGVLTPLYERAMSKHDREKEKLVSRFMKIDAGTAVLDVGCAVGTFLLHLNKKTGCVISGVDFKEDLSYPDFNLINFYQGLFYEQNIASQSQDLVTMWHFFEHDYDPVRSLQMASKILKPDGKLIIEVPRLDSLTFRLFGKKWPGVQAPQHTMLLDKKGFLALLEKNGFVVERYLPYGAFPSYFYVFTGAKFRLFGKGLDLDKAIFPYFLGQLLLFPFLLFQRQLNLSMQTVVCRVAS